MADLKFGAIVSRGLSETAHYARRVEELGYDGFGLYITLFGWPKKHLFSMQQ